MAKKTATKKDIARIIDKAISKPKTRASDDARKNIIWFKDISITDIPLVGGKGASLGELFGTAPIPDGFCVTAQAYESFFTEIKEEIMEILDILDVEDTMKLDKASERIRTMVLGHPMPDSLQKEILGNYDNLRGFVAVRSSATAEDLPTASFAGQQDTYLNVTKDGLLSAVQRCWASLFTSRAIYYRVKNKFEHKDVLISVVVQKMVDSKKAGVLFTANVVTNDKSQMIIEGAFGLGESVVSGQITPDYYLVDKKTEKVLQKNVAVKDFGLFRGPKGGVERRSIAKPEEQVLTDKELKELVQLGLKIEKHYKHPQDIEWAVDDKVYILQSRPITTLK